MRDPERPQDDEPQWLCDARWELDEGRPLGALELLEMYGGEAGSAAQEALELAMRIAARLPMAWPEWLPRAREVMAQLDEPARKVKQRATRAEAARRKAEAEAAR